MGKQLEIDLPKYRTHENWRLDECENSHKFPTLTDPNAEVYTVAELLARHEKGLLTNLNIGRDAAYPKFVTLDDRDVEKDMRGDATDRFHLANELDELERPAREARARAKAEADEKERIEKERSEFEAKAAAEGWVKPSLKGGDEGGAKAAP